MLFTKLPIKDQHTKCTRCCYMGCNSPSLIIHLIFHLQLFKWDLQKRFKRFVKSFSAFDYSKIDDIEVDGIDTHDYPDFCDAYIASASYKGRPMTQSELDRLNEDSDFVYSCVESRLY